MQQEAKALFDANINSQLINIIGEQIAMNIDQDIINGLVSDMARKQRLENDKHISKMDEKEIKTHISDIFEIIENS